MQREPKGQGEEETGERKERKKIEKERREWGAREEERKNGKKEVRVGEGRR